MFGLNFGIKDFIDVLLVGFILYESYRLLRRSGALNLFWGIIAFIFIWIMVSYVFSLELTAALFERVMSVGAIALMIIFQEEIRGFFYRLGSRFSSLQLGRKSSLQKEREERIHQLILACGHMSTSKTGALIILSGKQDLTKYAETGEHLDAKISARMIENIFFKNTPLHDGALILLKGRLHSAACILPVSNRTDIPQHYGLRHRAALGIAEKTDAMAIVVSEETGNISVAYGSTIEEISNIKVLLTKVTMFAEAN